MAIKLNVSFSMSDNITAKRRETIDVEEDLGYEPEDWQELSETEREAAVWEFIQQADWFEWNFTEEGTD